MKTRFAYFDINFSGLKQLPKASALEAPEKLIDGRFWSLPAPSAGVMGCRVVPGSSGGLISAGAEVGAAEGPIKAPLISRMFTCKHAGM